MRLQKLLLATTSAALLWAGAASAALELQILTTESFTASVVDTTGSGSVSFNAGLGSWIVNMTDGRGSASIGAPELDLVSLNVSSFGPDGMGGITIMLSESDLSVSSLPALTSFFGSIGGASEGSVDWEMWIDDGNQRFATSQLIDMSSYSSLTGSGTAFASSFGASRVVDDLFSMTLIVRIAHGDGDRATSFTFNGSTHEGTRVAALPEPGTLLLIGVAFIAAAWVPRSRRSRV